MDLPLPVPDAAAGAMRRALGVLGALGLLLACGPPPPEHRTVALRFLEPPVEILHDPASLLHEEEVESWDLSQAAEVARWTVGDDRSALRRQDGSTLLVGSSSYRIIDRAVHLDADRVQALDLTFGRSRGTAIELLWAPPGEPFSRRRRLAIGGADHPLGHFPTVRFPVADHPQWRGTIGSLRLTFAVSGGRPMRLQRLRAVAVTPDPDARAREIGRPRLIDLDGDVRSALVTPPGAPAERPLTVPADAVLEAVCGVTARGGPRFELRAVFAGDDGSETELLRHTVEPSEAGAWHPVEVRLDELAGRTGRLRLESSRAGEPPRRRLLGQAAMPAWGHPEVLVPAAEPAADDAPIPNVVLISVDTLRADRLSLYGNPRPTSPRLDAWARRRAVVFETAVASAPWTLPAHTTMLTGVDAHRHGVNYWSAAPEELTTVAERMQVSGRRTLAVTGGSFLSARFGLAQGFDALHYFTRRHSDDPDELADGTRRAIELIEAHRDRPFFLFFHTYEPHAPYRARQPWFRRLGGSGPRMRVGPAPARSGGRNTGFVEAAGLRALPLVPGGPAPETTPEELVGLALDLYDSAVAYTDEHLGEILAALRRLGLEDRTAVVITSDHGEMLGEHDLAGHAYLYDENLLVPLLVAAPDGRGAGRRVSRQVRQADVAPTLLELAGLDPETASIDGRSLVPWLTGTPALRPGDSAAVSYAPRTGRGAALRVGGRAKYVLRTGIWPSVRGPALLFDLRRDSAEQSPRKGARGPLRRQLIEALETGYDGLYLAVANAGPALFEVRARGETFSRNGVQSLDLSCGCVSRSGPFGVRIVVPPGESFTLRLENPQGRRIEIEAAVGQGRSARRTATTIELADIDRPEGLTWRAGRWLREPIERADGATATGLTIGWAGGRARSGRAPASEGDSRLRRQLRALGYLD